MYGQLATVFVKDVFWLPRCWSATLGRLLSAQHGTTACAVAAVSALCCGIKQQLHAPLCIAEFVLAIGLTGCVCAILDRWCRG